MAAVLEVRNISKSFPGVKALESVSVTFGAGEVHAVTGENGAGKSTLMKILNGIYAPDSGEVLFRGQPIRLKSPQQALESGIAMIHQELLPFPDLTVAENIAMGREPTRGIPGWLDKSAMRRDAAALLERMGVAIAPTRKMKELSVAQMQTVEIAKALAHESSVVIMDEPTSALSEREVEALYAAVEDLKSRGVAVIYISHKMDEIFHLSDQITVLRDGRHVGTQPASELNEQRLIAMMVGRELNTARQESGATPGDEVLRVNKLTRRGQFHDISFSLRRGEILGIAGLMGAGRTELVSAIAGLAPADSGEILVSGVPVHIRDTGQAIGHGIAMVSEDRKVYGLAPQMSVAENITLASLADYSKTGFIQHAKERAVADEQIKAFSIKTPDRDRQVRYLSGGNQQKVIIAKALLTHPAILILDEPTRGIDVGAKGEVYAIMRRLAREGKAILMVSSEMAEILALSDRVLVMREGTIAAEVDPHSATQEQIMRHAMPA